MTESSDRTRPRPPGGHAPKIALSFLVAAAAMLAAAPAAAAQAIDLGSEAELTLGGEGERDLAGSAVSGGCDIDGDGRDDQVVGSFIADPEVGDDTRDSAGAAYVIRGDAPAGTTNLGDLGDAGFRIAGAAAGDSAGFSVGCTGDVNRDGRDDVIVGAFGADPDARSRAGSAYVVFGKEDGEEVDLADLGDEGFRIDGALAGDGAGIHVAGAGDVNDDGNEDVIVGANLADNNGASSGSTYVVFGKSGTAPVELEELGSRGFRIDGAAAGDQSGFAVDEAGDVNGDGRPDVLVGAFVADPDGRNAAGEAYVVFGRNDEETVELDDIGDDGFRIKGAMPQDRLGVSVAGAGDVDDDGRDDLLLGADQSPNPLDPPGYAFVLYGKEDSDEVDLLTVTPEDGYRLEGAAPDDNTGFSVDNAGDVNADGRPDAIVGAYTADPLVAGENDTLEPRNSAGVAYVVYGRESNGDGSTLLPGPPGVVPLAGLELRPAEGFRLDGAEEGDRAGRSVSGAGDANDDGADDLFVGADFASPESETETGAAYRVHAPEPPERPDDDGGDDDDTNDGRSGRDGDDDDNGGGNGGNDEQSGAAPLTAITAALIGRTECATFRQNFGAPAQLERCVQTAAGGLLNPIRPALTLCREAGFSGRRARGFRRSDLSACELAVARTRARFLGFGS